MKLGDSVRLPDMKCTDCGTILNGGAPVHYDDRPEPTGPQPGTITVCAYCGHIMAFDEGLTLRNLNDNEVVEIAGDPRILRIQAFRKVFEEAKKERDAKKAELAKIKDILDRDTRGTDAPEEAQKDAMASEQRSSSVGQTEG